jgi:hypothetical protein
LTGGCNSVGSTPARRGLTASLDAASVQWRSTARAGYGSCPESTNSTALRATASAGSASALSGNIGA